MFFCKLGDDIDNIFTQALSKTPSVVCIDNLESFSEAEVNKLMVQVDESRIRGESVGPESCVLAVGATRDINQLSSKLRWRFGYQIFMGENGPQCFTAHSGQSSGKN